MIRKRRRFELRKTLFLLPNLITLSSIFCGFDAIRRSATAQSEDDFYRAALLIVFAMFFDTLDGRVARMTKTQSAFGLQIDSLADIVSFGVAPSMLVYQWTLHRFDLAGLLVSFLFTACGAIRLARFNVLSMGEAGKPTKPSKYIVGLPIPGAAGILVSIVVANHAAAGEIGSARYASAILATTTLLSFLMVSTIRFRSFKDLRLNVRTVLFVAFAVGSSAVISTQLQPAFVLVWLLGFYVLLGIFESLWHLPARLRGLSRDSVPPPRVPPAA
ncbi:CDP-diacylglycerol--serine O-phosphatidyltransferase [Sorangium cellulosum]|uniref:CDP-diacylglycerol--serine O-phosphatidyltransferase n=1 Tax=Sorangium cellulosum TaxID=56 RepID=A0A4P2PW69_SORCE|nr:CDP-diacylglycerol--serine O-phosphatidyltransferase [Sorangium cellulosum]AUX21007.1 CDP-diacylglycerol--serine O-phosphatidyltransferase [Sorangium cellulosum]